MMFKLFNRTKAISKDYVDAQIESVRVLTQANHDFCASMRDLMNEIADTQMKQQSAIMELRAKLDEIKV